MMRFSFFAVLFAIASAATPVPAAQPDLSAESLTIGRNLQDYASIRLAKPAPPEGVEITVTSDDPVRLLLAKTQDGPASSSISLKVQAQAIRTPEFTLRALAASGTVTYTISAPGRESAKGTVTLAPSAIAIVGPFKAPRFQTTPRGDSAKFTLASVVLDSSGKIAQRQDVGSPLEVEISNSNANTVTLQHSKIKLNGGTGAAETGFRPTAVGESVIAPIQPAGFTAPAERASVTVAVDVPGLGIVGDLYLGKDLQTPASLVLGTPAPPGGLKVTLESKDSSRMLLSTKEDQPGSASIVLTVPEGQRQIPYYIQALSDSGRVSYTAAAPGYREATETIVLTASGLIVAYEAYGAPDEGNVKRKIGAHPDREFFVSLADARIHPVRLVVWTAYIDPSTGRSADFTVQPLRAGVHATAVLKSSNPAVATIESPVTINPGFNRAICTFTPLSNGTTLISLETPKGFSTPKNTVTVPATVRD